MIEVKTKQDILLTKGTICLIVYQPWCGYCQMLKKLIIDKNLEKKYPNLRFIAIQGGLVSKKMVDGFPTIFILKNHEKVEEFAGFDPVKFEQILSKY